MAQLKSLTPIGERIDAARQRRGLSLYRVAKNAHMDYAQLHRTMRNTAPTRESLLKICKAIGCTSQEMEGIFTEAKYLAPTQEELEDEEESSHAAA